MRKLAIILGGAALLAACESTPPPPPPPPDLNNPLMAPGYMAQAGSSDAFEIQSGQLALQASQNPAVRNVANMIIADHTRSTQMILAAAQSAVMTPPGPTILPPQQAMLDQLRSAATGSSFDQSFQQIQIQAHQQALTLHQNYVSQGDVPTLRATAAQIVPVVQAHLEQLQSLQLMAPPPPPVPSTRRSGERG